MCMNMQIFHQMRRLLKEVEEQEKDPKQVCIEYGNDSPDEKVAKAWLSQKMKEYHKILDEFAATQSNFLNDLLIQKASPNKVLFNNYAI